MRLRYPVYFEDFRCIASACPDSCCKEWDVLVDEECAARYMAMDGALGERLRHHLHREGEEWYFTITDGRCPMWRQDGLCCIQAEAGHEALCQTCQDFPRLTHEYGDFVERGLELSCPEAARIIFSQPDAHWLEKEVPGGEEPEYEAEDMEVLLRTRKVMLTILENTRYSAPEVLTLALLYGYRAQDELDGADAVVFAPEEERAFARSVAQPGDPAKLAAFYAGLEILTEQWRSRLETPRENAAWDEKLRILARYGVERYWLQAISDFDLVGRVKMIIASCLLVAHLGGDLVQTAQLYAKEIENNADNVDAILDGAYTHPALTDAHLLGLLLEV